MKNEISGKKNTLERLDKRVNIAEENTDTKTHINKQQKQMKNSFNLKRRRRTEQLNRASFISIKSIKWYNPHVVKFPERKKEAEKYLKK